MHSRTAAPAAFLILTCTTLAAQDILYYRFDDNHGDKAINYAAGSPAPAQGQIQSTLPNAPMASWTPGRFGGASLASGVVSPLQYNRVDTGWNPGTFTGSLSYAMWLRITRTNTSTSLFYVFGCPTAFSFRVFGSTSTLLTSANGISVSASTVANVVSMANQNWVHVAYVLDATALTVQYYVNGQPEPARTLTSMPSWTSATNMTIGQQLPTSPGSIFDIDEFLFTSRVLSAAEILAMANSARSGDAAYGGGCGGFTLGSTGGVPSVGNAGYMLTLNSTGPLAYVLGIGSQRASLGGVPLPFDLGTLIGGIGPCTLDSGMDVISINGAKGPGLTNFPLPIPNNPSLGGATLFLQAPAIGSPRPLDLSNAFSLGIGF